MFPKLFYVQYQSFKIFTLRMGYIHRMIGRLGELIKDSDPSSRLSRCAEHSKTEHLLSDCLRAGEGKEDSISQT